MCSSLLRLAGSFSGLNERVSRGPVGWCRLFIGESKVCWGAWLLRQTMAVLFPPSPPFIPKQL